MANYGFQLKTKLLQLGLLEEFQRKNGGAKTVLNGLLELHGLLGPWLLIEVLGLPSWVLGCTHGLQASAWAWGAGIKVPPPALREWADG